MAQRTTQGALRLVREGRTRILLLPRFEEWLRETGIEHVGRVLEQARTDPHRTGRGTCSIFRPEGKEDPCLIIRPYAHGGLFRRFLGDRFLFGSRPFREMMMTEEIRRRGIPTVEVMAALCHRGWGPVYRGKLITREITGARDLVSFLLDLGNSRSEKTIALGRETAREAGRTVRLMHDRGVCHGDLNLKNLLVQVTGQGAPRVYIIDFDRSRIRGSLTTAERVRNLLRLNRSAEKWKAQGIHITYGNRARFFQAYAGGDGEIIQAMKRRLRWARLSAWWHRMGWRWDRFLNRPTP